MTDPLDSLTSFQQAFNQGELRLQRGAVDQELFVYADNPQGETRFSYVRLQNQTVTALVVFVLTESIEGIHCFQMGYAVPEAYHRDGPRTLLRLRSSR